MSDSLREKVREFVAIAKECPQHLQEKCFEFLLADYLNSTKSPSVGAKQTSAMVAKADDEGAPKPEQADIQATDLHIKARKFMSKYSITIENINQILYKEADQLLPLYEDLKTTRAAESQVRIALLQSLVAGLHTGEFHFDGEAVRKECQERKCYDRNNFAANFKNNATLFDGLSKYSAKSSVTRLSESGRKELADLIGELG